jgi:hypothetical protein
MHFYLERNVFLEMKSFVGDKVKNAQGLFGQNAMINNWFTQELMKIQIGKWFDIKATYNADIYGSTQRGWLCEKTARIGTPIIRDEWVQKSRRICRRLLAS